MSYTDRDKMNKSIKNIFVPELRKLNFKGSLPHFRRTIENRTNLITFQFDRDGGGFVVELANYLGAEFTTSWGKQIPLDKLKAHDINERQRIYPNSIIEENGKLSWFRYDKTSFFSFSNRFDKIANQLVEKLPIMNKYWEC